MSAEPTTPAEPTIGVLICDDNKTIRGLLRVIIEGQPSLHVVGEASDGNEAVAEAARHQPTVILLDLAMPRRSGFDAIVELGRVAPGARIIIFTGFSMASVGEDLRALGPVRFLSKSANPDAIVMAIAEAAADPLPVAPDPRFARPG